ncbi:MAG: hypothetical protein ACO1SX_21670 [Actinomycetota bacterium]
MESKQSEETSERDQLWDSLRGLLPEIRRLAQQEFTGTERETMLVTLLARIVCAELDFRAGDAAAAEAEASTPPSPSSNGRATPHDVPQDL